MAEDDGRMSYSDIIEPDDSIEKLIKQLGDLGAQYEGMVNAIKAGADNIVRSIRNASGATSEGRKTIDEAAVAASRLEKAQKELAFAMSDTGKEVARLKAQTSETNRTTLEMQKATTRANTSYDKLKADLKDMVNLYKALTAAERADADIGKEVLKTIISLKSQIYALDKEMKPHIQTLNEVEKAKQKLNAMNSAEYEELVRLKKEIASQKAVMREQVKEAAAVAQAEEKLTFAQSEENEQLKLYSTLISEANRKAKLTAQLNNSAEGSYNKLAAQYELNKMELNAMSKAEREAADVGGKLEEETKKIYEEMNRLQEATGNYRLNVGHYEKAWSGLGFSVSQVVRELPAAAVSLNTFFLGISNNVPMVVDEINKLREKNKKLAKEGEETVSVGGEIAKSLFSWNTLLVVMLTVFSAFGQEIIDFTKSLVIGARATISMRKALMNINKELENTNNGYGDNIVSLMKLRHEWGNLESAAEKTQWIADNTSAFDSLGISINSVFDAENVFVRNTGAVIKALQTRAKAAAAQKLASEEYEKALIKRNKAQIIRDEGPGAWERIMQYAAIPAGGSTATAVSSVYASAAAPLESTKTLNEQRAKFLDEQAEVNERNAEAYFNLSLAAEEAADAVLKAAGIEREHGKTLKDLTDTINRNSIKLQREYEQSITKLQQDEFAKRRKEIADQVQDENNKLREMYRKNEEYVNNLEGKYKELTEEQKAQIAQQQDWINKTIINNLRLLSLETEKIQREQQANSVKVMRTTKNAIGFSGEQTADTPTVGLSVTKNASQIEKSLIEERDLLAENLRLEYDMILEANQKMLEEEDANARSEEEIVVEYNKKKIELLAKYDKIILDNRAQDIEDRLSLVKKGSQKELQLLLKQNEIARQLALSSNAAKPAEEQVSSSIINAQFSKQAGLIEGEFQMTGFDEQQQLDEAVFNEVKHNENEITKFKLEQEKARWEKQIELAESGGLDWSQAQIDAAKATVKGIDRELAELDDFIANIGKNGLGTTLLERLGFDDDQIGALKDAINIVLEQIQEIMDAEVEMAEKAVEAAEKRTEAAQSAYEAEVEARNNGYAHNVATAKKELEQEKKNQKEKQKLLETAQKRQESVNAIIQSSSLVTASANLWSSFSSIPVVGPALALAAIATMWTSFAVAKIKAKQVASASEEYGEGGLEFLEGGSHASGNDIALGTTNRRGKHMRAEGGEAMAIINKKHTAKYRKILPDVIDSFNKGTFEDKYLNAFSASDSVNLVYNNQRDIDLSGIEDDVRSIKKQNETKYYVLPNGNLVICNRNVKRIIKN